MLLNALFYGFAGIAVLSSLMVLCAKRTIHSVLALILVFLTIAGTFVLMNAAFLGLVLVILYVGAVAVFFLFAVLMFGNTPEKMMSMTPLTRWSLMLFGLLFASVLGLLQVNAGLLQGSVMGPTLAQYTLNIKDIGKLLYTTYFLPFQGVGCILLLSIIGGVKLALRHRLGAKKQIAFDQTHDLAREKVQLVSPPIQKGVKDV